MEQKTILQLTALGTFSFALGIISTLTIQTIVGPQSNPSLGSSEISSSQVESSLNPQGPWQGFSDEWDVQASENWDIWEGLTPEVLTTLEQDYPGYDIDEVHVLDDEIFVFIELDILLNNEINVDTDIFLFFHPDGTLTREFIFEASDAYTEIALGNFEDNVISDITNDPLPYRDGLIFTMSTVASVDMDDVVTEVDGFLSFVLEEETPRTVQGLYYFDAKMEVMYTIEQYDSYVFQRDFNYFDLQVSGNRYLLGRSIYYYEGFVSYYPFDLFEENAKTNITYDYASFNPDNGRILLTERFGFYTNRVYVDLYTGWGGTIFGDDIDLTREKLSLEIQVYLVPESYDSQDQWFHTLNMDFYDITLHLNEFIETVDPLVIGNWYQLRYTVLFNLNFYNIDHLELWYDLTDLEASIQGYVAYDFEHQRVLKAVYTYRYLEIDDVYFGDTTLEYKQFNGTLITSYDFEGIFDLYYLQQNQYGQFIIAGRTIELSTIEGEDRVTAIGTKIWMLGAEFNLIDSVYLSSLPGVELWDMWIYETEIRLDIVVNGGVYDGLLQDYAGLEIDGRLTLRIPFSPVALN